MQSLAQRSCDDLLKGLVELGTIDILVVFHKFQVGVAGEVMAFKENEAFAFEGEGVLIELVEKEDAVGDLDREFRVFRDIVVSQIA